MPTDWPPRFTWTTHGIAGVFLLRFKDATPKDQDDLTAIIDDLLEQARAALHPEEGPDGD